MFSLVQFSHSVMSSTLQPHGLQHTKPLCPSQIPRACSNSCPLSQWCHSTISSSVISSCVQSFPASESFPMSQFFTSGGQKYCSFSFSISPSSEYSGLISFRMGFPGGSAGKESAHNAGDLGRSPGEGNGSSVQFSGLENSMGCIVHGVARSRTWLSDFHFYFL